MTEQDGIDRVAAQPNPPVWHAPTVREFTAEEAQVSSLGSVDAVTAAS